MVLQRRHAHSAERGNGRCVCCRNQIAREENPMKEIKVKMKFLRSTPGTHVWKEAGDDYVIGTLYIRKSKVEGEPPQEIEVTVTGKKNKK